jgi:hypothetical protein
MLYDVLVVSNGGGGKRFTTEQDGPLSVGDTFEQDSESYRVLAIQTGHGPFDYVIEVEWLASLGPSDFEPGLSLSRECRKRPRRFPSRRHYLFGARTALSTVGRAAHWLAVAEEGG